MDGIVKTLHRFALASLILAGPALGIRAQPVSLAETQLRVLPGPIQLLRAEADGSIERIAAPGDWIPQNATAATGGILAQRTPGAEARIAELRAEIHLISGALEAQGFPSLATEFRGFPAAPLSLAGDRVAAELRAIPAPRTRTPLEVAIFDHLRDFEELSEVRSKRARLRSLLRTNTIDSDEVLLLLGGIREDLSLSVPADLLAAPDAALAEAFDFAVRDLLRRDVQSRLVTADAFGRKIVEPNSVDLIDTSDVRLVIEIPSVLFPFSAQRLDPLITYWQAVRDDELFVERDRAFLRRLFFDANTVAEMSAAATEIINDLTAARSEVRSAAAATREVEFLVDSVPINCNPGDASAAQQRVMALVTSRPTGGGIPPRTIPEADAIDWLRRACEAKQFFNPAAQQSEEHAELARGVNWFLVESRPSATRVNHVSDFCVIRERVHQPLPLLNDPFFSVIGDSPLVLGGTLFDPGAALLRVLSTTDTSNTYVGAFISLEHQARLAVQAGIPLTREPMAILNYFRLVQEQDAQLVLQERNLAHQLWRQGRRLIEELALLTEEHGSATVPLEAGEVVAVFVRAGDAVRNGTDLLAFRPASRYATKTEIPPSAPLADHVFPGQRLEIRFMSNHPVNVRRIHRSRILALDAQTQTRVRELLVRVARTYFAATPALATVINVTREAPDSNVVLDLDVRFADLPRLITISSLVAGGGDPNEIRSLLTQSGLLTTFSGAEGVLLEDGPLIRGRRYDVVIHAASPAEASVLSHDLDWTRF